MRLKSAVAKSELFNSVLLVAIILAGCHRASDAPRPAAVPKSAVFAGSGGRAAYFDCSIEPARNVNRCHVYRPNGELWCYRDFRLEPEKRYAKEPELKFDGFDGEDIVLQDSLRLKPLLPCDVED
jgi:hypothetical protein